MPPWFLPLLVFVVCCLWVIACASQRAAEDARRGVSFPKKDTVEK